MGLRNVSYYDRDEFASIPFKDILHVAKNVEKYKFERSEHQALIKELAFRLRILKGSLDRF